MLCKKNNFSRSAGGLNRGSDAAAGLKQPLGSVVDMEPIKQKFLVSLCSCYPRTVKPSGEV